MTYKRIHLLLLCFVAFLLGCATSKSGIGIPPYQEFVLGENEKSAFRAELDNQSDELIEVETRNELGKKTSSFGLSPKGKTKITVASNERAILRNPSGNTVLVQAKLSRNVEGMRYQVIEMEEVEVSTKVTGKDLKSVISDAWKGELTYANYSDGRMVSIPCNLKITQLSDNKFSFEYIYPDEPKANNKQKIHLKKDGQLLGDQQVVSKEKSGNQLIIKTIKEGKDNGEKALFFYTYTLSEEAFSMKKEYQTTGSDVVNFRNEYVFKK